MQKSGRRLLLSPSDLADYLACEHLTQLEVQAAGRRIARPQLVDPQAELLRRKGQEHERRYLEGLRAHGREIVEIPFVHDFEQASLATSQAIESGIDVVYQACLVDNGWRGFADFVELQPAGPEGVR